MNKNFNIEKNNNLFIIPKGRAQKVTAIQDYSKAFTPTKYTGKRFKANTIDKGLKNKQYPFIAKAVPQLHMGKVKTNYKQKEIFDMDNTKVKKIAKPKFNYVNSEGIFI